MKYNKYPKVKDSGVEWIGDIPDEWEVTKARHLGKFETSSVNKKIEDGEEPIQLANYMDVYANNKKIINKQTKFTNTTCSLAKILKNNLLEGDMLFTPSSETVEDIGFSVVIDENLPNVVYSYHVVRLRFQKKIFKNFKKYLFNNNIILNYFSKNSRGTTRQTLKLLDFKNTNVIIPSLNEQKQISEFLDKQTTQFDELIAKSKSQITLLKEKRQVTINQAVTKGLDPSVSMKDSGVEWIGEIPEDWEVKKLKFVANFNNSTVDRHVHDDEIPVSISHYPQVYHNETISLKTKLSEGTCSQNEFENFRLKKDDVLITKDSEAADDIGVPVYILDDFSDAVCGYHIAQLSTDKNQLFGGFLFRFIQSSNVNGYFETKANGVTRYGLDKDSISNLIIPLPPKLVQEQIYDFLQNKTTQLDELIAKSKTQITLLEEKKQALITAAVTGKIDVRDTVA
jgi:type I restriction enzyme, S subunit